MIAQTVWATRVMVEIICLIDEIRKNGRYETIVIRFPTQYFSLLYTTKSLID